MGISVVGLLPWLSRADVPKLVPESFIPAVLLLSAALGLAWPPGGMSWKDGVPQVQQSRHCEFFFVLCLAEITFIQDLMIMKIQKKEKQVCDPLSFSQFSCQGLRTMSHVEMVAIDVWWEGGWGSVVLNFQTGVQLSSLKFGLSCTPEWVSLMWPLNKVGFTFSSGNALDLVLSPVEEQPFFLSQSPQYWFLL